MNKLVSDPLDAIQTLSLEEVHLATKKEESKGKHIRSDSIVISQLVIFSQTFPANHCYCEIYMETTQEVQLAQNCNQAAARLL